MDSIGQILKTRESPAARRLLQTSNESTGTHEPYVPDHCVCASIAGAGKMGWIYATHFTDGTEIPKDHPAYGRAFRCACGKAQDEKRWAEFLRRECNVPPASRGREFWSFSDFECPDEDHRRARDAVREWASGPTRHRWLFLHGPVGTGKTHLACAAVVALVGGKVVGRYEFVPDLIDYLREHQVDGAGAERIAQLRAVEALVLDDLGATSSTQTEWAQGEILKLIDWRYREQAPLLVATNVMLHELEARTLDRLQDRYLSRTVPLLWESYR